jgi:hypothetical protein
MATSPALPCPQLPGVCRRRGGGDEPIADVDAPRAVETLDNVGSGLRVAAAPGPRQELEADLVDPDRVVGSHGPRVMERTDAGQVPASGDRPVGARGHRRRDGELGVEGGQEGGSEEGVPGRARRDPREPELRHEPILERVPQALDPPFRLRALRHKMGNRERGERLADLRRVLLALEFLGERPVRIVRRKMPWPSVYTAAGSPTV